MGCHVRRRVLCLAPATPLAALLATTHKYGQFSTLGRLSVRETTSTAARRRGTLLLALLFAAASIVAARGTSATAQTAQGELEQLEQQQSSVAAQIDADNRAVDQLIGEMSQLKQREDELRGELAKKQAELQAAAAALNAEEAHLEEVRGRLQRALVVLRERLVEIYKSEDPDMLTIVLESASWSDVEAETEYLSRIQDNDKTVVVRVQTLRNEVKDVVARLTEARNQIEAAKNSIVGQRQELQGARASLEARRGELIAARAQREKTLASLTSQANSLEGALSGPLSGGETVPSSPGKAGLVNGIAVPPPNAPAVVRNVIAAANQIADEPYVWGGGHGSFESSGYDCSGAVSYALHGGGLIDSPVDSRGLMVWGSGGFGRWITVFANDGHAFAFIAGLRWDTGGSGGGSGPRWHSDLRSGAGYVARHASGY